MKMMTKGTGATSCAHVPLPAIYLLRGYRHLARLPPLQTIDQMSTDSLQHLTAQISESVPSLSSQFQGCMRATLLSRNTSGDRSGAGLLNNRTLSLHSRWGLLQLRYWLRCSRSRNSLTTAHSPHLRGRGTVVGIERYV